MKTTSHLFIQACSLLLGFLSLNDTFAQRQQTVSNDDDIIEIENLLIHENDFFNYFMKKEVSRITQANSGSGIGNFAGISTTDDNLNFAYNFVFDKGLLELNAAGGIKDGISQLVSDSKFNTNIGIGVKYKRAFKGKVLINRDELETLKIEAYDTYYDYKKKKAACLIYVEGLKADYVKKKEAFDKIDKLRANLEKLAYDKKKDSIRPHFVDADQATYLEKKLKSLLQQVELFNSRLKTVDKQSAERITELKRAYSNLRNPTEQDSLQFEMSCSEAALLAIAYQDTLRRINTEMEELQKEQWNNTYSQELLAETYAKFEIALVDLNHASKKMELDGDGWNKMFTVDRAFSELKEKIRQKQNDINAEGVQLHLFSIGASFTNENFSLYNSSLPLADRIYRETDLIPSLQAGYIYYLNNSFFKKKEELEKSIRYFSINASVRWGNNISSLKHIEIETRDSIAGNQTRVSTQKVYDGVFESGVVTANISADYYQYLGTKDNVGFHVRALVDIGPFAPVTSLRGGLLFSALDKNKERALLNFEIFYGLNNLFKTGEEQSLLSRNVLGIQTSFPFDFNLNKKDHE